MGFTYDFYANRWRMCSISYYFRNSSASINDVTNVNYDIAGQLFDTILDIWQNFTVEYVQNLYLSISRRVLACIRSKGHITKY
jgi:hypothetical protein